MSVIIIINQSVILFGYYETAVFTQKGRQKTMLEKINEINVWDRLRACKKPIVLYGMGNGAEQILSRFKQFGIAWDGIFASDGFVRGQSFCGKKVRRYDEICQEYGEFVIVLGFASARPEVLANVQALAEKHTLFAPDVPVCGGGLFTREYVAEHNDAFDRAYALLADERSRRDYLSVLNFKVSGKIDYLLSCFAEKKDIYKNILHLSESEAIADLGAYTGDTVQEILCATGGRYKAIYALEPNAKSFQKLQKNTAGLQNVQLFPLAAWDKNETLLFGKTASRGAHAAQNGLPVQAVRLDDILDAPVTLLKMDVEGAEARALAGAAETIRRHHPKLYVCAYHRNEDLFALPLQISRLGRYNIYFRHTPYIPAWESNFYCTPQPSETAAFQKW